jgi:hypothetical protein
MIVFVSSLNLPIPYQSGRALNSPDFVHWKGFPVALVVSAHFVSLLPPRFIFITLPFRDRRDTSSMEFGFADENNFCGLCARQTVFHRFFLSST